MLVPLPSSSLPPSKLITDFCVRIGWVSADRGYNEMMALFVPFEGRAKDCCGILMLSRRAREKGVERNGFKGPKLHYFNTLNLKCVLYSADRYTFCLVL
jgi:hypothetical protein